MRFLRLLTLQIIEGRLTVEAAQRIVIAKAECHRELDNKLWRKRQRRYRTIHNASDWA